MYRAILVHFFDIFFLYRGFAGDLRIEIGSKKCTGGGGHLWSIGTMSTEVEGHPLVHFFD